MEKAVLLEWLMSIGMRRPRPGGCRCTALRGTGAVVKSSENEDDETYIISTMPHMQVRLLIGKHTGVSSVY